MAHRERKRTQVLEVSVLFEPSRLALACVAKAYESVVPLVRRPLPQVSQVSQGQNDFQSLPQQGRQSAGGGQ